MKISTMKATGIHANGMFPQCNGDEKTLISCFSPEPTINACYYLLVECTNSTEYSTQTPAITASNTPLPTGMSSTLTVQHTTQTPVITPSNTPLPTGMNSTLTVQHTTRTPVINTPLPTDMSGTGTEDGGIPIVGIAVAIVVLILLILLVIVLIVILSWKNRHHKAK